MSASPDATLNLREPKPAGENWTVAASGKDAGVMWTIFTTPATDDGLCAAIELDPPPSPTFNEVIEGALVYKSHQAGCFPRPGTDRARSPAILAFGTDKESSVYGFVYGVQRDDVRQARGVTSSGQSVDDVAAGDDVVFLFFLPAGDRVERLRFTLDGGEEESCAVKWIGSVPIADC